MHDQLLGTTQPVLSIFLQPGESVIAEVGGFAWMTDSIAMAAADNAWLEPRLCVYTATGEAGTVAFAAKLPGRILSVDIGPGYEGCLVRESSLLAGTPGVRITAETGPTVPGSPGGQGLALWRISGSGRAWVELSGDVVRHELTGGQSLRAHPRHIGMFDATVAVQVAELQGLSGRDDSYPCAVLSGPGMVWLRSMPSSLGDSPRSACERAVGLTDPGRGRSVIDVTEELNREVAGRVTPAELAPPQRARPPPAPPRTRSCARSRSRSRSAARPVPATGSAG